MNQENEKNSQDLKILEEMAKKLKKQKKRIKDEIVRLRAVFNTIEDNKLKAVNSIIENVAFMTVTLADLQDDINLTGVKEEYKNGKNQWGMRENPSIGSYNAMIPKYSTLMKQLIDLLPGDDEKDPDDGFEDFINS